MSLLGCEQESLQFFPQDKYLLNDSDKGYEYRRDVVVVVSPPKKNIDLIKVSNKYIKDNYSLEEIAKYKRFSVGFLRESSNTKRIYQDRSEYADYKEGLRPLTTIFDVDDWLLNVRWVSGSVVDYYHDFSNEYKSGCPSNVFIRLNGERELYNTDNCSATELQDLTDYIDAHWQELSVAKYRETN